MSISQMNWIFDKWVENDKSFLEKPTGLEILFGRSSDQLEKRKIWHSGVRVGISIGLDHASLEGQKIHLFNSATSPKHKEYLQKSWALAREYGVAIQYVPHEGGLCVIDVNYKK